ncbi:MAG: hypothetical protein AAFY53_06240 [Pseudomonadota bacterium]
MLNADAVVLSQFICEIKVYYKGMLSQFGDLEARPLPMTAHILIALEDDVAALEACEARHELGCDVLINDTAGQRKHFPE